MRVLMATDVIAPGGGPAGYTSNLLEGFRSSSSRSRLFTVEGITPELVARHRTIGQGPGTSGGGLRRFLDRQPLPMLISAASRAKWLLSAEDRSRRASYKGVDVVVFQGYQSSTRAAAARRQGRRVVYMPHSPTVMADEYRMLEQASGRRVSSSRRKFLEKDEARLFRLADYVVFPSPNAAQEYERVFPAALKRARRRYIASGVPPQHADVQLLRTEGQALVLFVGRYVAHKGYDLFLDAAELLVRRGVDARFATVGSGDRFRTSAAVADIGWSNDPAGEIARADVVVVPNRVAYFDLLPLEVASQGKPLVMTRVGGNLDQLEALPDSVGAAPEAAAIADAVAVALQKRRRDPDFGRANAAAYSERFTVDRMAQGWTDFLHELVANTAD